MAKKKAKSTALAVVKQKTSLSLSTMTPQQAINSFNEEEMQFFKQLHAVVNRRLGEELWWYWNLGKQAAAIYKTAQQNSEVYGKHLLERLSIALTSQKSINVLRNAMNVVRAWPTKQAYTEVLKWVGEANNRLSWTHLIYLSSVNDEQLRDGLIGQALEQGWNAKQLYAQIKAVLERKRNYGGRPPKVPTSVAGCLSHMTTTADKFVNLFDNAWSGKNFNLVDAVNKIPPDKLGTQTVESLQAAETTLTGLQVRVSAAIAQLQAAKTVAEKRAAAKEAAAATDAIHKAVQDEEEAIAEAGSEEAVDDDEATPEEIAEFEKNGGEPVELELVEDEDDDEAEEVDETGEAVDPFSGASQDDLDELTALQGPQAEEEDDDNDAPPVNIGAWKRAQALIKKPAKHAGRPGLTKR